MPPYAVHVTMAIPWKGLSEEFENVFHYDVDPVITTDSGWQALGDAVVAGIRPLFTSNVSFKRVRIHGRTDTTKADDVMKLVYDLTGAGTATAGALLPPEMAVNCSVYMGRGPRGGKQFLRKYIHGSSLAGGLGTSANANATSPLTSAMKAPYISALNGLKNITVGGATNAICNPQGKHLPVGSDWTVGDYVTIRQFRRRGKRRVTTP